MNLQQKIRENILPRVNPYARRFGFYTAYTLSENELIGSTNQNIESAVSEIQSIGYDYNGLSATKIHPSKDIVDNGSYRRVPKSFSDVRECRITENWSPEETQFHIHLFDVNKTVELYSHFELRPDIFNPHVSKSRLETHYRPQWSEEYILGAVEEPVLEIID